MKKYILLIGVISFFSIQNINAQCCGNNGGCADFFEGGGMYFGYSTSKLSNSSKDISENMELFNSSNPNYYKPYTFNKNGRGLNIGVYYYLDNDRRSFINLGYTNKHYLSNAEGDSAGIIMQRVIKFRQETFDVGYSYLPAKFLKAGLELNAGHFGVFRKSGPKEGIKDANYQKYYTDQGFLFGVTPSLSLRLKLGFFSFYITPYYQWTPSAITHFDSNADGIIDQYDKRYSNNLSNYGVNFSMYLFIGGINEK